jgi:tetratricopeptide (TPR) repeat protein
MERLGRVVGWQGRAEDTKMRRITICALTAVALCWMGAAQAAPKGGSAPGQLTKQAREAMDRGDYDAAIELYTQAISNNPDAWQSYFNRGAALMKRIERAQAKQAKGKGPQRGRRPGPQELEPVLQDLDRAAQLAGDEEGSAEVFYERGRLHFLAGNQDKARADHAEALRRDPSLASRGDYGR